MPATEREAFVLRVLDGLAADLPAAITEPDARWYEGYACALNTARTLIRDEIAYRDSVDEGVPGYVAVPGVGGEKSAGGRAVTAREHAEAASREMESETQVLKDGTRVVPPTAGAVARAQAHALTALALLATGDDGLLNAKTVYALEVLR